MKFEKWCPRFLIALLFAFASFASAQSSFAESFAKGLTLYLPFDGDADAFVAKGNPMEMAGGVEVTFVQGKIGQAVHCGLKGKHRFLSYLTTSENFAPNISADQGTIAFWVKPDWDGNETSERFRHFFSIRSGLFYLYWWHKALTFSSTIRSQARHHYAPVASVAHWKAGEWHYVAVTWQRDKKTLKGFKRIFLDGQLVGEAEDVLMDFELTGALIIGGLDGSETFERLADAAIDEFAVWERVLSKDEIEQLMKMGQEGKSLSNLPSVRQLAEKTKKQLLKVFPPQKGNLLFNSSFEVGTRPYRASNMSLRLDETTKVHGERSACFDASHWTGTTILTSGLFFARSKVLHTFSLWLKSEREDVTVKFGIYGAYVGGSEAYGHIFYGLETQRKISTQWQRYQVTGELPPSPQNLYFVRIAVTSSQPTKIWLDALQLEEGEQATEFRLRSPFEAGLTTDKPFHLFHPDETIQVRLSLFAEPKTTKLIPLTVTVFDVWDKVVARQSLTAKPNSTQTVKLRQLPTGSYRISLFDVKGKVLDEQVIAVLPKFGDKDLSTSMGIHVGANETGVALAKALGCGWVRLLDACAATHWDVVEPKQGEWTFERERWIDEAVDTYKRAGLQILGLLFRTPLWASSGDSVNHPPKDLDAWRRYVRKVAEHFKGRIDAWEVWNEPNALGGFLDKEELYLQMTRIAAEEIKAVDPESKVVAPCTYWQHDVVLKWTERLVGMGLLNFVDIFSFHGYNGYRPSDFEIVKVWAHGDGKQRPIWNTEQGMVSQSFYRFLPDAYDDPYTRWITGYATTPTAREAAALLVKGYVSSLAAGCEKFFQYWAVPEDSMLPRLKSMSLLEFDNSLRPKAVAWAIAGWILDGSKVIGFERKGDLWLVQFQKGEGKVTVVWSEGEPVKLTVPKGTKVLTMMGTQVSGDENKIVFGSEPIYLIASK
ncbi:MAG: hypothetical protein NZ805_13245 [Armatimonadetes bacterium]|nr:hypothetical protein [Armatimonadota bacterium]